MLMVKMVNDKILGCLSVLIDRFTTNLYSACHYCSAVFRYGTGNYFTAAIICLVSCMHVRLFISVCDTVISLCTS